MAIAAGCGSLQANPPAREGFVAPQAAIDDSPAFAPETADPTADPIEPPTEPPTGTPDALGGETAQAGPDGSGLLRLAKPIDCTLGEDCFVLLYPDRDPGTGHQDYTCGPLSYDAHKGTDFAIAGWPLSDSVDVLASAPGTVLATRDGVADRRLETPEERSRVSNIECGNGVLVDHGGGWQTQYCHLREDSIRVGQGDRVETGTVLGQVGLSGMTTFPHVHITVRKDGEVVDPFVGPKQASGCAVANPDSLWTEAIAYVPTDLIGAGFAPRPPGETELWRGDFDRVRTLPGDSEALIFWIHAYGIRPGDEERYRLVAPDGSMPVDHRKTFDSPRRNWISYVGQATNRRPLMQGNWRAFYELRRDGRAIVTVERAVEVQ